MAADSFQNHVSGWLKTNSDGDLERLTTLLFSAAGIRKDALCERGTQTGYGEAIDPIRAAWCTINTERHRTGQFIKALWEAIKIKKSKIKDRPLRIAELGCGPLAPIALSVASQLTKEEIQIHLVDYHQTAIEMVKGVIEKLNLQNHVASTEIGDLTKGNWAHLAPDIVVTEVMMAGLLYEPQGAVTAHLIPQFPEEVLWLPEDIQISGELFEGYQSPESERINLGEIVSLDERFRRAARAGTSVEDLIRVQSRILLPEPAKTTYSLALNTRISILGGVEVPSSSRIRQKEVASCFGRVIRGHNQVLVSYKMGDNAVDLRSE